MHELLSVVVTADLQVNAKLKVGNYRNKYTITELPNNNGITGFHSVEWNKTFLLEK